ncbi:unnamed protein product [Callosobruchus maculatus]|uniref:Macro domain-containing protein n=1 Tax=Callosobruchus maculatus TaxID=64391 RepID=A0A653C017_CALMS|nr:unnamed protein product [Callosobruchus maculatus]
MGKGNKQKKHFKPVPLDQVFSVTKSVPNRENRRKPNQSLRRNEEEISHNQGITDTVPQSATTGIASSCEIDDISKNDSGIHIVHESYGTASQSAVIQNINAGTAHQAVLVCSNNIITDDAPAVVTGQMTKLNIGHAVEDWRGGGLNAEAVEFCPASKETFTAMDASVSSSTTYPLSTRFGEWNSQPSVGMKPSLGGDSVYLTQQTSTVSNSSRYYERNNTSNIFYNSTQSINTGHFQNQSRFHQKEITEESGILPFQKQENTIQYGNKQNQDNTAPKGTFDEDSDVIFVSDSDSESTANCASSRSKKHGATVDNKKLVQEFNKKYSGSRSIESSDSNNEKRSHRSKSREKSKKDKRHKSRSKSRNKKEKADADDNYSESRCRKDDREKGKTEKRHKSRSESRNKKEKTDAEDNYSESRGRMDDREKSKTEKRHKSRSKSRNKKEKADNDDNHSESRGRKNDCEKSKTEKRHKSRSKSRHKKERADADDNYSENRDRKDEKKPYKSKIHEEKMTEKKQENRTKPPYRKGKSNYEQNYSGSSNRRHETEAYRSGRHYTEEKSEVEDNRYGSEDRQYGSRSYTKSHGRSDSERKERSTATKTEEEDTRSDNSRTARDFNRQRGYDSARSDNSNSRHDSFSQDTPWQEAKGGRNRGAQRQRKPQTGRFDNYSKESSHPHEAPSNSNKSGYNTRKQAQDPVPEENWDDELESVSHSQSNKIVHSPYDEVVSTKPELVKGSEDGAVLQGSYENSSYNTNDSLNLDSSSAGNWRNNNTRKSLDSFSKDKNHNKEFYQRQSLGNERRTQKFRDPRMERNTWSTNWRNEIKTEDPEYEEFLEREKSKEEMKYVKVTEKSGDLFEMPKEYSLGHCVAEDLSMGSGIAVHFKREFRELGELYAQRQKQGGLAILEKEDGDSKRYIYYLVTKRESSGKPTYLTFWSSVKKMRDHIRDNGVKKLAIPRIGCGLDRLEWSRVKDMIEFLFRDVEVEIIVCNFQQNYGQTKQKLQTVKNVEKTPKQNKSDGKKNKNNKKKKR